MDEFKESSQGFDAFEKFAADFQENPLEFKRQFTSGYDQFTSDSDQSFLQLLGDKLAEFAEKNPEKIGDRRRIF